MSSLTAALDSMLKDRPYRLLCLLCVSQLVVWTLIPALFTTSPPLDVAEMLAWGQEWKIGHHKHPPLPAWLSELSYQVFGSPIFGPALMSQLCIVITFVLVFAMGQQLLGTTRALLGTCLLTGQFYFSWSSPEFNHNVVQMPIWAAIFYLFSQVWRNPERFVPWVIMGVVAGLGLYAKYSVLVLYLVIAIWVVADRRLRGMLLRPGPWVGGVLALVIAMPHLMWVVEADFIPLDYAQTRSQNEASFWSAPNFLLAQLLGHLPMLIPLTMGGLFLSAAGQNRQERSESISSGAMHFLAIATFAPALLTAVLALLTGSGLKDMWGMPMFVTSGLFVVAVLDTRIDRKRHGQLLIGCFLLLAIVPLAYALNGPVRYIMDKNPSRTDWPMQVVTTKAVDAWHKETGLPLKIVGGDFWLAVLVSAGSKQRPHVLLDKAGVYSPWITPADIRRDGILLLYFEHQQPEIPDGFTISAQGKFDIGWTSTRRRDILYGVIKPSDIQ
jgi:hypothetical protein